jgi:hypothetical protein
MDEMLHCHHCGELIGVYEPLITFDLGKACETSRAAGGSSTLGPEAHLYHRVCFEITQEQTTESR